MVGSEPNIAKYRRHRAVNVRCLLKLIQEDSISSSWGWKQYLELILLYMNQRGQHRAW